VSATSASAHAIVLRDVTFSYDGRPALIDVSLEVPLRSFTALIGPNGAGKSTVLKLLLGLHRPKTGTIEVLGSRPGRVEQPIGYVPQRIRLPTGFPLSVHEVVLMGRYGRLGLWRRPGREDHARARDALERVGMLQVERERFGDLSGGQQQRVLIARALCAEPRLLILDEPTAGLDPAAQARFYTLVCDLQRQEGLTLLCASHDLDVVSAHADLVILLDRRVRAQGAPSDVLGSRALDRSYGFPPPHVHRPGE
jgi:ABC-type Mn2+/Zn2+ transport system ATPase subunit